MKNLRQVISEMNEFVQAECEVELDTLDEWCQDLREIADVLDHIRTELQKDEE